MSTKSEAGDSMMGAIQRICVSLEGSGVPGKGASAALREMSSHWTAVGAIDPSIAMSDIEKAQDMLDKVRKALSKQAEHTGPIKLVPRKISHSHILSESAALPLGSIRVSNMNFEIPRNPETEKIMISILKGAPGKYKQAAMEILEGRTGLLGWHEKNIGPLEGGPNLPIQDLIEAVAAAMYHRATAA